MKTFKTISLPQFVGKTLAEVKDFVEKEYKGQLATIDDREAFIESKPELNPYTWCFFFGSLVRASDGRWSVPCAGWGGSGFGRGGIWLDGEWDSVYRVVLLDDSLPVDPLPVNLGALTLDPSKKLLISNAVTEVKKQLSVIENLLQ